MVMVNTSLEIPQKRTKKEIECSTIIIGKELERCSEEHWCFKIFKNNFVIVDNSNHLSPREVRRNLFHWLLKLLESLLINQSKTNLTKWLKNKMFRRNNMLVL